VQGIISSGSAALYGYRLKTQQGLLSCGQYQSSQEPNLFRHSNYYNSAEAKIGREALPLLNFHWDLLYPLHTEYGTQTRPD